MEPNFASPGALPDNDEAKESGQDYQKLTKDWLSEIDLAVKAQKDFARRGRRISP